MGRGMHTEGRHGGRVRSHFNLGHLSTKEDTKVRRSTRSNLDQFLVLLTYLLLTGP